MSVAAKPRVAVIGAGIVGLCVAHELGKAGREVEVIDPAEPGSQCTFGNAGAISSGSVAPLAMPGIMRNAAKMLLDADSPLHVPFHYWLHAAPWLARFVASANPQRVEEIALALECLFENAVENHQALAREVGCPQRVVQTGQLHLYRDEKALSKDAASWRLRAAHGVRTEKLDMEGIRALEPAVAPSYPIGILMPDQGLVTEPFLYAKAIAEAIRAQGGKFVRERVVHLSQHDGVWQVRTEGRSIAADQVVIAAGAWSAALLRPLGLRVPLESQRGYHLHVDKPGVKLGRPVVLTDRKIFISPMESGLRIAGTVEFGGLSKPPTHRRALILGEHAREGLPDLRLDAEPKTWMGHRPCLPDSLPVLGPVPGQEGLWCAFGHGHLGITGAINSARWIAGAFRGDVGARRFAAFSVSRFL